MSIMPIPHDSSILNKQSIWRENILGSSLNKDGLLISMACHSFPTVIVVVVLVSCLLAPLAMTTLPVNITIRKIEIRNGN